MTTVFLHIVQAGITASFVALVVMALRWLLKKAPKWLSVALWGLVAIRLLVPFSIETDISLVPDVLSVTAPQTSQSEPLQAAGAYAEGIELPPLEHETVTPPFLNVTSQDEQEAVAESRFTFTAIAAIVWLAGMAVMLGYAAFTYVQLRLRVRAATKLSGRVYQSEAVGSPFVLGVFRPRIYMPYTLDEAHKDSVLAHEQAHIKRGDHIIKPLGFLLLSVYWFHPLLWVAYILLCRDIELACDERVVNTLTDEQRKVYSQALLVSAVGRRRIAACPLAFGEVGVKERIKSVMHYKKPAFWIVIGAVVLSTVAAVCLLTDQKTALASMEDVDVIVSAYHNATDDYIASDYFEVIGERDSAVVEDHAGGEAKFTVKSYSERNMTVTLDFSTPLWKGDEQISRLTLRYDEAATLTTDRDENGNYTTYEVEVDLPSVGAGWTSASLMSDHATAYVGENTVLLLYPSYYEMSFCDNSDYVTRGNYEFEDDTLILTETAGLTRMVFDYDEKERCWYYKPWRSYRHKAAHAPKWRGDFSLSFSYAYEIECESAITGGYRYAVKNESGEVLVEEEGCLSMPTIHPVTPTLLSVTTYGNITSQFGATRFWDMTTGTCSDEFRNTVCATADEVGYVQGKDGSYVLTVGSIADGNGAPSDENYPIRGVGLLRDADVHAMITDGEVTLRYTDKNGQAQSAAYDRKTGKEIVRPLLIVETGLPIRLGSNRRAHLHDTNETGTVFYERAQTMHATVRDDNGVKLWYSGVRYAALFIDGAYVDPVQALEEGTLTLEKLEAMLKADVQSGKATAIPYDDGVSAAYHYNGMDEVHSITLMHTELGVDVYIGVRPEG